MAKRKQPEPERRDFPGAVSCAEFILPYPPSVNHCWGTSGKSRFLTSAYKAFLNNVALSIGGTRLKVSDCYFVDLEATPPDNRTRDIDNVIKPTLDALTRCCVWPDDKLVVRLSATKCKPNKNRANVRVVCGILGAYSAPQNDRRPDALVDEFFANFKNALAVKDPNEFDPKIRALAYYYQALFNNENDE